MPCEAPAMPDALQPGIGLRQPHYAALLHGEPAALGFVEVHSENFFGDGGAALAVLEAARERWPLSLHGVGLGLASAAGVDPWHLERLAALVARVSPALVSDHAAFARAPLRAGAPAVHAGDLLPPGLNDAGLAILAANVQRVQDRLRRPIAVENLSAYLQWTDDTLAEPGFFNALSRRSGCQVLLDLNNLVVNALNALPAEIKCAERTMREAAAVRAACAWVDAIDAGAVAEIHLAGYAEPADAADPEALVIDDHGSRVHAPVWQVYRHALARLGPRPTLIEWDTALPPLDLLLDEAERARALLRALPRPAAEGLAA